MRLRQFATAAALAAGLAALTSTSGATPFPADTEAAPGNNIVRVHSTCHANVRRHYDPDLDEVVEHLHSGRRCRVELVEDEEEDCHANAQSHVVVGINRNRPILHRHRGRNCTVVLLEDEVAADCHREPREHRVGRLGTIWHRHVGPRCEVEELNVYRPGQSARGCIQVGPVRVCP